MQRGRIFTRILQNTQALFSDWRKEAHSRQRTRSRRAKFRTSGGRATELRVYSWKWAVVKCQLQGGSLRRGVISLFRSRKSQAAEQDRLGQAPQRGDGRTAPISRVSLLPREASLPVRGLQSTPAPPNTHTQSSSTHPGGGCCSLFRERLFYEKQNENTKVS